MAQQNWLQSEIMTIIMSLHGISNEHVKKLNALKTKTFVAKHEVVVNWAGIYKRLWFIT